MVSRGKQDRDWGRTRLGKMEDEVRKLRAIDNARVRFRVGIASPA